MLAFCARPVTVMHTTNARTTIRFVIPLLHYGAALSHAGTNKTKRRAPEFWNSFLVRNSDYKPQSLNAAGRRPETAGWTNAFGNLPYSPPVMRYCQRICPGPALNPAKGVPALSSVARGWQWCCSKTGGRFEPA